MENLLVLLSLVAQLQVLSRGAVLTRPPPTSATRTTPEATRVPEVVTKKPRCELKLPPRCACAKTNGDYSISCQNGELNDIPKFNVGPHLVKTINVEQNNLTTVQMGDFFGLKIERLLMSNNSISELNFLAFWGLEYHLEALDLSYNIFTKVPADALRLLRNLRSLTLTGNRIIALRDFDFGYLRRMEVLALDKNPIAYVADRSFAGTHLTLLSLVSIDLANGLQTIPTGDFKYLKGVSLGRNGIKEIPRGWFKNLKSLRYLNLDENKLSRLPSRTFEGIERTIRTLYLNGNKLRKIPKEAFRSLRVLEFLGLSGNRIRKLHARSFNNSHTLQKLDLSRNYIDKVHYRALNGLDHIQTIDLRENHLITLDDRTFYWRYVEGKQIYLKGNDWLCNCLLKWIKTDYKKKTERSGLIADVESMKCARPYFLEGSPIVKAALRDFTCDHDYYYYYYYDYEDEENAEKGTAQGGSHDNADDNEEEEETDDYYDEENEEDY